MPALTQAHQAVHHLLHRESSPQRVASSGPGCARDRRQRADTGADAGKGDASRRQHLSRLAGAQRRWKLGIAIRDLDPGTAVSRLALMTPRER